MQQITCKNCNNQFTGKFCNTCGEKVYTDKDKSLKIIFTEAFHFFTHFEGSFLITLKAVFTKPGKLSLDYCNGIRKKYFKPVSFFFVLVILYLLFPRFPGLNMKLDSYLNKQYGFTWASIPLAKAKMETKHVEFSELSKIYNSKSSSISKIGLFVLIPIAASFVLLLFFRTKKYFFDHFIISLELCSLFIALHFLVVPFISFIAELINSESASFFYDENYRVQYFQMFLDLFIVSIAFKRFYGQKWIWIIPKAFVYLFIFNLFILYVYRLMVLVVTLLLT